MHFCSRTLSTPLLSYKLHACMQISPISGTTPLGLNRASSSMIPRSDKPDDVTSSSYAIREAIVALTFSLLALLPLAKRAFSAESLKPGVVHLLTDIIDPSIPQVGVALQTEAELAHVDMRVVDCVIVP